MSVLVDCIGPWMVAGWVVRTPPRGHGTEIHLPYLTSSSLVYSIFTSCTRSPGWSTCVNVLAPAPFFSSPELAHSALRLPSTALDPGMSTQGYLCWSTYLYVLAPALSCSSQELAPSALRPPSIALDPGISTQGRSCWSICLDVFAPVHLILSLRLLFAATRLFSILLVPGMSSQGYPCSHTQMSTISLVQSSLTVLTYNEGNRFRVFIVFLSKKFLTYLL